MIGVRYTSTASGEAPKFVTCKKCGHGYGYWMTRTGSSSNTSWFLIGRESAQSRSSGGAEAEVARRLKTEHDPVPCPECGHYQKNMYDAAREAKYRWVMLAGIAGALLSFVVLVSAGPVMFALGGRGRPNPVVNAIRGAVTLGSIAGVVLVPTAAWGLKRLLSARYDPNKDPKDDRIDLGRERAMSPKEYARLTRDPEARDDDRHRRLAPEFE